MKSTTRRASVRAMAKLAMGLSLMGCDGRSGCSKPAPPEAPTLALDAHLSGCETVLEDGKCLLGPERRLRWWVNVPENAEVGVRASSAEVPVKRSRVQGGEMLRFEVPAQAGHVELRVRAPKGVGHVRRAVADAHLSPAVREMQEHKENGACDQVQRTAKEALDSLPALDRARGQSLVARCEIKAGRFEAAVAGLQQASELHRKAGSLSGELMDQVTLVYVLTFFRRELAQARAIAEAIEPRLAGVPRARAIGSYHYGLLQREVGDLRASLRLLRDSERQNALAGLPPAQTFAVRNELAGVLLKLGRKDEAIALLERERDKLPDDAPPCLHAQVANNLGWSLLETAAADDEPPHKTLEQAAKCLSASLALVRTTCKNPREQRNALINLARTALLRDDVEGADERLAEARAVEGPSDVLLAVWMDALEGRSAMQRGQAREAIRSFERMAARARRAVLPSAAWRAELGIAEAHELLGRDQEAAKAYAHAEAMLEEQVRLVPVMEGIESFLTGRQRGARLYVDLLIRLGEHDRALRVARRARARALLSTRWVDRIGQLRGPQRAKWDTAISAYRQQRAALNRASADDWKLSVSQLHALERKRRQQETAINEALEGAFAVLNRAEGPRWKLAPSLPPQGEAVLMVQQVREGFVGFVADAAGVHARALGSLSDVALEQLGSRVLGPFHDVLEGARRIRVLAHGPLRGVDVHALLYREQPVVARWEVVYSTDVRIISSRGGGTNRGVLIVADPRQDLPAARQEAARVQRSLRQGGNEGLQLLSGPAASHGALVKALPGVRLFHYAGHGEIGRETGWSSRLPLAEGGGLTVGDILSFPNCPTYVVLSGCDTARTHASGVEGIGLAQAFILNGSDAVVATMRPVKDWLAELLMSAMYDYVAQGVPLEKALARAQNDVRKSRPQSDWGSFRVLGP